MKIKSPGEWELLARGRTADIFKVSDTEAVKLFLPGYSLVAATEEYERSVFINRVYDKSVAMQPPGQHQGRISISMDFIRGRSLCEDIRLINAGEVGLSLGMMHRNLHIRPSEGLPDAHRIYKPVIEECRGIPEKIKKNMLLFVMKSRNDRLCHGAFHPGHILQGQNGLILIDWKQAFAGDPLADIAASLSAINTRIFPRILTSFLFRYKLADSYLKGYFGREPVPLENIHRWQVLNRILEKSRKKEPGGSSFLGLFDLRLHWRMKTLFR